MLLDRKDLTISKPSIARSTATMSVATALSRITGFVRTWATAAALGATTLAASYSVANNVPNMIFELVAGGILSALFIPTYLEVREQRGEEESWRFASHVFNLSVIALGFVAIIGIALPQPFIWTQTFRLPSSGASEVRDLAEFFFRIFAIQVVVYGGGMVVQGLLNARRRYLWPALGPVFNNVVVISTMFAVAAIGTSHSVGLVTLAVGTTLGVVAMFAVMVPDLVRTGIKWHPELGLSDPYVRRMLLLAVPTLLYVVTNLIAVSFRNASAFAVSENGPAIVMYAWNFYQLPYGVLAVALATAVFTELSEAAGKRDMAAFKSNFTVGLRTTGVLILPSAAALVVLATPLVSLYRVGAFDAASVAPVASALRLWGFTLIFFAAMMFVLRSFYSLKDTWTPAYANLGLTSVQIALYWTLTTGVLGWSGLGINGIPIADGVFYALMLITLLILLRRKIGGIDLRGTATVYLKMVVASLIGGVAGFAIVSAIDPYLTGVGGSLVEVLLGGIVVFGVALSFARLLGVKEVSWIGSLLARIRSRFTFK